MNSVLIEAAEMPLLDAAYALWRAKRRLDAEDRKLNPAEPCAPVGAGGFDAVKSLIQGAIKNIRDEREHAPEEPTFFRLKLAHPQANVMELKAAIRAAVKLDADGLRHFSYKNQHYFDDVREAVRLARIDSPGFGEISYERLFDHLAHAMR